MAEPWVAAGQAASRASPVAAWVELVALESLEQQKAVPHTIAGLVQVRLALQLQVVPQE
jgi:hypothetical protein